MPSNLKIISIIIAGLAIIGGSVWLIFYWNKEAVIVSPTNQNSNQPVTTSSPTTPLPSLNQNLNKTPTPSPLTQEDKIKIDLKQLAQSFAERFGSYSNQSNYKNIEDLYNLMTSEMRRWAENLVTQMRSQQGQNSPIYSGLTTKALSATVTEFNLNNQQAVVKVKTQRREAIGSSTNTRVYYQDILINFSQIQGIWKVSGAYWQ